jgi:LPS sulfotransferase NodH
MIKKTRHYLRFLKTMVKYIFFTKNKIEKKFVIFTKGRSGSTALVSLLKSQPEIQCDGEILSNFIPTPMHYVLAKTHSSTKPIYGFKLITHQLVKVQPLKKPTEFLKELHQQGYKIIYLRRENLVQLAISNIRAREFGFHIKKNNNAKHKKTNIDIQTLSM